MGWANEQRKRNKPRQDIFEKKFWWRICSWTQEYCERFCWCSSWRFQTFPSASTSSLRGSWCTACTIYSERWQGPVRVKITSFRSLPTWIQKRSRRNWLVWWGNFERCCCWCTWLCDATCKNNSSLSGLWLKGSLNVFTGRKICWISTIFWLVSCWLQMVIVHMLYQSMEDLCTFQMKLLHFLCAKRHLIIAGPQQKWRVSFLDFVVDISFGTKGPKSRNLIKWRSHNSLQGSWKILHYTWHLNSIPLNLVRFSWPVMMESGELHRPLIVGFCYQNFRTVILITDHKTRRINCVGWNGPVRAWPTPFCK